MLGLLDRWITRDRVAVYAVMLLTAEMIAAGLWAASLNHDLDPTGTPVGGDFLIFYAASALVLKGKAVLAYAAAPFLAAQHAVVPASRALLLYAYPPVWQLMAAPLALLPFLWAYAGFELTTFLALLAVLRSLTRARLMWLATLAFPAVFLNALQGQNGFLTAALIGFGLAKLDRRPWLAGVALGLACYKPHLGVLLPVLLAGSGRWRPFVAATATVGALVTTSLVVFGVEDWRAFLTALPEASAHLDSGALPWAKMPSLYVAMRSLGASAATAAAVQALGAVAVAGVTLYSWRAGGAWAPKAAMACFAVLIASPYAFDYDLVLLAVPIALLVEHGRQHRLAPGSAAALSLAYMTPVLFRPLAQATGVQLMPFALLLGFLACWRSDRRDRLSVADPRFRFTPA